MDQGESLEWLDLLEDLVNLECLEKQDDKDPQELLVCMDQRDPMDQEVHLETEDHQDSLECLELRVRRDPLVPMVQQAHPVHQVLMVLQGTGEFQDYQVPQVLLAPEGLLDPKEREEMLVLLERKDPPAHLVLRVHLDRSELEVKEEKKDLLERLELLAWEGDPVTKDLLAPPDLLDHLALLVFLDLLENLVLPETPEKGERGVQVDLQE